jgi:hypothetical protein
MSDETEKMSQEELLRWNLVRAEQHASQALDLIYGNKAGGIRVPRGFWWRRRLLAAQNHLMTLTVRELNKKG